MATEQQVGKCLAILRAAFPAQVVPEVTFDLYVRLLSDLPAGALLQACAKIAATGRFWPSVAEIRETVAVDKTGAPTPEEAWGEVVRAVSRWGRYRTPEWTHPLVGAAVECLGWQEVCDSDMPEATRARYLDAYKGLHVRTVKEEQIAGLLPGREERKRIAGGAAVGNIARKLLGGRRE